MLLSVNRAASFTKAEHGFYIHLTETEDAIKSKLSGYFESLELIGTSWLADTLYWSNPQCRFALQWPSVFHIVSLLVAFVHLPVYYCHPNAPNEQCCWFFWKDEAWISITGAVFFLRALNGGALGDKGCVLFTSRKQCSIVDISLGSLEIDRNWNDCKGASVPAFFNQRAQETCISSTSSTSLVESKPSAADVYNGLLWMLKELYQAPPYKSRPASEVGALHKLCKFSRKDNNKECRNSVFLWGPVQAQDVPMLGQIFFRGVIIKINIYSKLNINEGWSLHAAL